MAKKGGLGRGFDSLFAENAADNSAAVMVRLSEIEPNRDQPRKDFDEAAIAELSDSISRHGLLQPLLVRPIPGGGYSLVAGERRWRACSKAELYEVPVVIREMDDKQAMELAMIENLQREDLNAVEEAAGYKNLMDNFGMTQEEVAESCGKSRSAVANSVRLLLLPEDILSLLREGKISAGHGRAILSIEDDDLRNRAVMCALSGASVREIENMAKTAQKKNEKKPKASKNTDNFYKELEIALKNDMGRKVTVSCKNKDSGTITIEYYSKKDLSDIAAKLSEK